jgi:hypothetical protein
MSAKAKIYRAWPPESATYPYHAAADGDIGERCIKCDIVSMVIDGLDLASDNPSGNPISRIVDIMSR